MIEIPIGLLVVRRPGGVEWHHSNALIDELLRARRLRISFRGDFWYRDDDAPLQTAEVPLEGLAPALVWCREAMASKRATMLHPDRAAPQGDGRGR